MLYMHFFTYIFFNHTTGEVKVGKKKSCQLIVCVNRKYIYQ